MEENSQLQSRSGRPMPHYYPSERTSSRRRKTMQTLPSSPSHFSSTQSTSSYNNNLTPPSTSPSSLSIYDNLLHPRPRVLNTIDQNIHQSMQHQKTQQQNPNVYTPQRPFFQVLQSFAESVIDEDFLPGAHPNCDISPRRAMMTAAQQEQDIRSTETTAVGQVQDSLLIDVSDDESFGVLSPGTYPNSDCSSTGFEVVTGGRSSDQDQTVVAVPKGQNAFHRPGAIFEIRYTRFGADPEFSIRFGSGIFECVVLLLLAGIAFAAFYMYLDRCM